MKKHTFRNYPFLLELRKEGWVIDKYNKHILINAYLKGQKSKTERSMKSVFKRWNVKSMRSKK